MSFINKLVQNVVPGTSAGLVPSSGLAAASLPSLASGLHAYLNSSQAITLGALTAIKFDATRFDRGTEYSTSTGRFTANSTGLYQVSYNLRVTGPSTFNDTFAQIQKNDAGTLVVYMTNRWGTTANGGVYPVGGSCLVDLVAGDTVRIALQIDGSGSGQSVDFGTAGNSVFTVAYIGK